VFLVLGILKLPVKLSLWNTTIWCHWQVSWWFRMASVLSSWCVHGASPLHTPQESPACLQCQSLLPAISWKQSNPQYHFPSEFLYMI
jgi:hypothetical protein